MAHEVVTTFNGQQAKACIGAHYHSPKPRRYIWHHILPQVCGGKTEFANLIQLCDNCHMTIHLMLWRLAQGQTIAFGTPQQREFASSGFMQAENLGTVNLIPDEGGISFSTHPEGQN